MLNEGQVRLLWERLFSAGSVSPECMSRANELIDELRPESPLRFRLEKELVDIRKLHKQH
jgi:hypothetical protein